MRFLTLLLLAVCAHAAVVEGVILDDETGSPLARTQITLTPLPGTPAEVTTVRAGARGAFVILSVRPGWYVLRATRRGYLAAEDGQSRVGRPGHAFEVTDEHAGGFHEIRMAHLAAVGGTVFDENGIGIPKWTVHVYTAKKPMRHITQTQTDDRGDFRIGELDPGAYYLRSGPGPLEDQTTVVATYSVAAVELKDALPAPARLGPAPQKVAIRPVKGKLFSMSGLFLAPALPGNATLTLITDTGRRDVVSGSDNIPFSTNGVQPGPFELLVSGVDATGKICGSYYSNIIDKDLSNLRVACNPINKPSIQVTGVPRTPVIVRRVDLDGVSAARVFGGELLIPGHWELSVPRGNYYVQSVRAYGRALVQAGDWYAFDVTSYTDVQVSLSTRYGAISGVVSTKGNPVTGAPVFVSLPATSQTWVIRSDPQGQYSVIGLGPGTYNLLSSFNLDGIDNASRQAVTVNVGAGETATLPLELLLP